jgi:hypothetical protein
MATKFVSTSAGSIPMPSASRRARVVVGEPLDVVVERVQRRRDEDPGLAQGTTESEPTVEQTVRGRKRKMVVTIATGTGKRGEGLLVLLISLECLACFFIWWGGLVIARGKQPEHRHWDMVERRRRADWFRNELEQRPWWWLMLGVLMMLVLVDWFMEKWEQRPWRAAMLWTIVMIIVVVVVLALTVHFGWGMKRVEV